MKDRYSPDLESAQLPLHASRHGVAGDDPVSITEAQISDLQAYLLAEVNDLTSVVTWANVPDGNITQSSVTQHVGAIDHNSLLNSGGNQHIDWTNATSELTTTLGVNGLDFNGVYIKTVATGNYGIGDSTPLSNITTGDYNTCFGQQAGAALTEGIDNVMLGYSAGTSVNTGNYNMCIGLSSGFNVTSQSNNVFLGAQAGQNLTSSYNAAIGSLALYKAEGGDGRNLAIGYSALYGRGSGGTNDYDYNIGIGYYAGYSIDRGTQNVLIGQETGYSITDGSNNIFLGRKAGYYQTTNSNLLVVDNQNRGSAGAPTDSINAILYGVMAATPASQTLAINADTTITGDLEVTGKLTVGGSTDPPLVLYDLNTRLGVALRVKREIPPSKQTGAAMFFNSDTHKMEVYVASEGKYYDLMGNLLKAVPVDVRTDSKTIYRLDRLTGEVVAVDRLAEVPKYRIKKGYRLRKQDGLFYNITTQEVVTKNEAVIKCLNIEYELLYPNDIPDPNDSGEIVLDPNAIIR